MSVRKSKKIGNVYGQFELVDTYHKNKDTVWIVKCRKCGKVQEKSRHSVENCTTECVNCGHPVINRNSCGHFRERIYHIYTTMIQRTTNPNKQGYKDYGGRGIKVCREWLKDFMKFYDWSMSHGYTDKMSIDRIDNDKGYSPDNCRWVDMIVQSNNRRGNKVFEINGSKKTVAELSREYGVDRHLIYNRLRLGWDIKKALSQPVDTSKRSKSWK